MRYQVPGGCLVTWDTQPPGGNKETRALEYHQTLRKVIVVAEDHPGLPRCRLLKCSYSRPARCLPHSVWAAGDQASPVYHTVSKMLQTNWNMTPDSPMAPTALFLSSWAGTGLVINPSTREPLAMDGCIQYSSFIPSEYRKSIRKYWVTLTCKCNGL